MSKMAAVNGGNGLHAKMRLAPALLVMLFAGDALAGDQPPIAAAMFAPPLVSSLPLAIPQAAGGGEFRARRRALLTGDSASRAASAFDAPMLQDTSIAGRMAESKSQDRVRLLTLWQSRASSLSLQAGRHGAPSLQWSTPWMHREGTSHGLFDRLITVSPHMLSRQSTASAPTKSAEAGSSGKTQ